MTSQTDCSGYGQDVPYTPALITRIIAVGSYSQYRRGKATIHKLNVFPISHNILQIVMP